MKVLFYYPSTLTVPNFQVLIDELLNSLSNNDQLYLAKCNRAIKYCESNPYANPLICNMCMANFNIVVSKFYLYNKISIIDLKQIIKNPNIRQTIKERDFLNLKKIEYKDYNIGFSVISSFVSRVRNISVETGNEVRLLENYFAGAKNVVDFVTELQKKYNFEKVVFYNGRIHTISPILQLAKKKKLKFEILEVIGGRDGSALRKQKYFNTTPFHRKDFAGYINENWKLHTNNEQITLSKKFFEFKRKGKPIFDKSYATKQTSANHLLTNTSYKKITIFNSSPDERASLGVDWEWDFNGTNDQSEIAYIIASELRGYKFEIFFRMHPNLKNYKGNLEKKIMEIDNKFENFHLIRASESVSSYDLLDSSNYILSFGSTIGVEATYWGKISIVIGKSFYDFLDISYSVKTIEELKLLLNSNTKPKPKKDTLKWALFYANRIYNVSDFHYNKPGNIYVEGKLKGLLGFKSLHSFAEFKYGLNNIFARAILKLQKFFGFVS